MANVKITDLTAYTDPVSTDVLPIVDVGADITKKVSIADLLKNASAGTAAAPGIAFDGDNTGIYSPEADQLAISTNGTGRLFVDANGNVGVGTSSPSDYNLGADDLVVFNSGNSGITIAAGNTSVGNIFFADGTSGVDRSRGFIKYFHSDNSLVFGTDGGEQARIDGSGRLLVGTSSARSNFYNLSLEAGLQIENIGSTRRGLAVVTNSSNNDPAAVVIAKSNSNTIGSNTLVGNDTWIGNVSFQGSDGAQFVPAAYIDAYVDGTPGANDMPGRLVFSSTPSGSATPVERMRIDNAGRVGFNFPTLGGGSGQYRFAGSITGAASSSGLLYTPTIQPDVTTSVAIFSSQVSTAANGGTPYTVANVINYFASQTAFNADSTVTNQIGYNASSNLTGAANNFGFYSAIPDAANRWNFYATGTAPNYFAGKIASLGSYNDTTASAANVFIASNGDIQRSTSSIRYKTDIETLEQSYADNVILNARPVWYRSLCEADNAGWSYYGLIAEEVAELDPRLVFWGRPTKEVLQEEAKDAVVDDEGNIIEPATEAVYTNIEDTDAELRPEGVQYDRLTVMLIDVVQRQQKAIEALEAKVAALEAR